MDTQHDRRQPRRQGRFRHQDDERPHDFTLDERFHPEPFNFEFEAAPSKEERDKTLSAVNEKIERLRKKLSQLQTDLQQAMDRADDARKNISSPEDRAKFDALHERSQAAKAARTELKTLLDELHAVQDRQRDLRKQFQYGTVEQLKAAIDERHYYFETHTLSGEEERRYVAEMRRLEAQVSEMDSLTAMNAELETARAKVDAARAAADAASAAMSEAQKEVDEVRSRQQPNKDTVDQIQAQIKAKRVERDALRKQITEQTRERDRIWSEYKRNWEDWRSRRDAAYEAARAEYNKRQDERRAQWEAAVEQRIARSREMKRQRARQSPKLSQASHLLHLVPDVQRAARSKPAVPQVRGSQRIVDLSTDSEAPWLSIEVAEFLRLAGVELVADPAEVDTVVERMQARSAELEKEGQAEVAKLLEELEETFRQEDAQPKPDYKQLEAERRARRAERDAEGKPAARARRQKRENQEVQPEAEAAPAPEQTAEN